MRRVGRRLEGSTDTFCWCVEEVGEEGLIVLGLASHCETIWNGERSRARAVQMENLTGLLGVRRMERFRSDERIDGVLRWFGHMENDKISKTVYLGECAGTDYGD